MKRCLSGGLALVLSAAAANAVCAGGHDLKALQAVALQQQLMAAALTCHFTDDYNRFVTTFRSNLLQSDRALERFFDQRRDAEGYNAFKTRIANEASLESVHNPRFCQEAKSVFDLALQRGRPDGGLSRGSMLQTGYQSCRPEPEMPTIASNAVPSRVAASSKPVRARVAAAEPPKAAPTTHVDVTAIDPVDPMPAARPDRASSVASARIRESKPAGRVRIANLNPAKPPPFREPSRVGTPPTPDVAGSEPEPATMDGEDLTSQDEDGWDQPAQSPQVRPNAYPMGDGRADRATADAHGGPLARGRNIPNAYLPGARWVRDVDAEAPAPPPWLYGQPRRPRWAYRHPRPRMIMGPDGRWYALVPYRRVWLGE